MDEKYIAGFFDGEGSALIITIRRRLKTGIIFRFRPIIKIAQKKTPILVIIQNFSGLGGVVHGKTPCLEIKGLKGVIEFVDRISPYSIVKRKQLLLIRKLAIFQKIHSRNHPYSKRDLLRMIELRDRVFALNCLTRKNLKQKYPKARILDEHTFPNLSEWFQNRSEMGILALNKYSQRIKKPRGPMIECACGCGELISRFDAKARKRKYKHGHNQRGKHWEWSKKLE